MYCTKCGKFIEYDAPVCNECLKGEPVQADAEQAEPSISEELPVKAEEVAAVIPATPQEKVCEVEPLPDKKELKKQRLFGFGRALTSAILGYGAFSAGLTYAVIGLIRRMFLFHALLHGILYEVYETPEVVALVDGAIFSVLQTVYLLIAAGLAIPSIILGVKSITAFSKRSKEGYAKPVATLVLGIVGVALCAVALICLFPQISTSIII